MAGVPHPLRVRQPRMQGDPMTVALLIVVAIVITIALPTLLIAATGGPVLVRTEHDLQPARTRRSPKEGHR